MPRGSRRVLIPVSRICAFRDCHMHDQGSLLPSACLSQDWQQTLPTSCGCNCGAPQCDSSQLVMESALAGQGLLTPSAAQPVSTCSRPDLLSRVAQIQPALIISGQTTASPLPAALACASAAARALVEIRAPEPPFISHSPESLPQCEVPCLRAARRVRAPVSTGAVLAAWCRDRTTIIRPHCRPPCVTNCSPHLIAARASAAMLDLGAGTASRAGDERVSEVAWSPPPILPPLAAGRAPRTASAPIAVSFPMRSPPFEDASMDVVFTPELHGCTPDVAGQDIRRFLSPGASAGKQLWAFHTAGAAHAWPPRQPCT